MKGPSLHATAILEPIVQKYEGLAPSCSHPPAGTLKTSWAPICLGCILEHPYQVPGSHWGPWGSLALYRAFWMGLLDPCGALDLGPYVHPALLIIPGPGNPRPVHPRIFPSTSGYSRLSPDIPGYPRIFPATPRIFPATPGHPRISPHIPSLGHCPRCYSTLFMFPSGISWSSIGFPHLSP